MGWYTQAGATFEVVPPDRVNEIMPQLQAISDAWLVHHAGGDKSFSMGGFYPSYVAEFPVGIVRFEGKLMVAEVSRKRLAGFMERANQDRPMPLDQRNGDFLYAKTITSAAGEVVRIVTTDWCASNQAEYFGAEAPAS